MKNMIWLQFLIDNKLVPILIIVMIIFIIGIDYLLVCIIDKYYNKRNKK